MYSKYQQSKLRYHRRNYGHEKITEISHESRYVHLVGVSSMSATPETGVCDKFGRSWDVPNLPAR